MQTPLTRTSATTTTTTTPMLARTPLYAAASITSATTTPMTLPRRHSLYGTEDKVIMDVGSRWLKVGFSGEPRPRHVLRVGGALSHRHRFGSCQETCHLSALPDVELHGPSIMDVDPQELALSLRHYLNRVYTQYLLSDPKQRRVVICESPLMPNLLKDTLLKVLFEEMQVPSVTFAPSAPMALLTADARTTGLVVDCGHHETVVMPVYDGRPLFPFIHVTPVAGKYLTRRLKRLLVKYARIVKSSAKVVDFTGMEEDLDPTQFDAITDAMLDMDTVENIQSRMLFVSPFRPLLTQPVSTLSSFLRGPHGKEADDDDVDAAFAHQFYDVSAATAATIRFKRADTSTYAIMVVPGWLRERACEVLLDDGIGDVVGNDPEATPGIPRLIVEALANIPSIDIRAACARAIVVVGGIAAIPNFRARVQQEVIRIIESTREKIRAAENVTIMHGNIHKKMRDDDKTRMEMVTLSDKETGIDIVMGERVMGGWGESTVGKMRHIMGLSNRIRFLDIPGASTELDDDIDDGTASLRRSSSRRRTALTIPRSNMTFCPNTRTWIGASLWVATRGSMSAVPTLPPAIPTKMDIHSVTGGMVPCSATAASGFFSGASLGKEIRREEWIQAKSETGNDTTALIPDWTRIHALHPSTDIQPGPGA